MLWKRHNGSYDYSPCGDLLAAHTCTNGDEVVFETYSYDMLGNLDWPHG